MEAPLPVDSKGRDSIMRNEEQVGRQGESVAGACAWLYAGYAGVGAFAGAMSAMLSDAAMPVSSVLLACVAGALGVFAWRRSVAAIRSCEDVASAPARNVQASARVMAH